MDFEVGQTAGDYEILALLGAGGMGKVYKVRNAISERVEAMKVLLARLDEHPELVDRFSREIKVTATLDHPNIAALRTAQRIGNQLAMVMEYVEGSTLDNLMRSGAMPLAQVLEIVNQALAALAYAHSRGVVHRDIKPANIMVTPEGRVKLMDFGIARMAEDRSLTKTGQMVGSLYYMSPEQVEGKSLDARSDLYSLGVTMYELVTGKKPFEGDSDYAILAGHLHQPPRPPIELSPGVPAGLNEIILMALAKDPNERFQTAMAFRGALNSVASEMGIPLSAPAEGGSASRSTSSLAGAVSTAGSGSATAAPAATPPMVDTVALPPSPAAQTPPPPQPSAPPPYAQQPQYAPPPQAPPMVTANPPARGGKRALWMVAGALAMLLILAGAVIYLPKWKRAQANPAASAPTQTAEANIPAAQPQPDPTQTASQPSAPAPTSSAPDASAASQASAPAPASAPVETATKKPKMSAAASRPPQHTAQNSIPPAPAPSAPPPAAQPPVAAPSAPPQPAPPDSAEIDKVQDDLDLLNTRAAGVRSSLDNLQRQQEAQGFGLRGDIVASRERMEMLMGQTQDRLKRGDIAGARKSLANAEREVSKLEKFLGR